MTNHQTMDCPVDHTNRRPTTVMALTSGPVVAPGLTAGLGRSLYQVGLAAALAAVLLIIWGLGPTSDQGDEAFGLASPESSSSRLAGIRIGGVSGPMMRTDHNTGWGPGLAGLSALQAASGQGADLDIEAEVASVDGGVRWIATIGNRGPGTEPGPVVVVDTLPAGSRFVSAGGAGWACQTETATNTVTCRLFEELPVGAQRRLAIVANLEPNESPINTMSVFGRGSDPDLSNNSIIVGQDDWRARSAESARTGSGGNAAVGDSGRTGEQGETSQPARSTGALPNSAQFGVTTDDSAASGVSTLPETGARHSAILFTIGTVLCVVGVRLVQVGGQKRAPLSSPAWPSSVAAAAPGGWTTTARPGNRTVADRGGGRYG